MRLGRSIAVCVAVLVGIAPAVTLACETNCAAHAQPPSAAPQPLPHQHVHSSPHHHGATGQTVQPVATPTAPVPLAALNHTCTHDGESPEAVSQRGLKLFVPALVTVPPVDIALPAITSALDRAPAVAAPPGGRSSPLPLRI